MRNTEDVTDTSSISHIAKDQRAINNASLTQSGDKELLIPRDGTTVNDQAAKKKKYIKIGLGVLGGIAVILAIVLPIVLRHPNNPRPDPIGPNPLPPGVMNPYQTTLQRSSQNGHMIFGQMVLMNLNKTILHEQASKVVPRELFLQEQDNAVTKQIGVDWRNKNFFGANNDFKRNLSYQMNTISGDSFNLRITTANETRFNIPSDQVVAGKPNLLFRLELYGLTLYDQTKENFGFQVHDVINPSNWFFDTRNQTFIFADKYIQMDFKLASQNVYGLGDRQAKLKLEPGALNMWASGQTPYADDGKGRSGLSGVHPFVMFQGKENKRYVGIFFRNSAAMTPVLKFNPDGTSTLSFITIGGDLDLYVCIKGTARDVIESYHGLLRPAYLPPFWALGWQEVFPDGMNQQGILDAVKSYSAKSMPLDAVYLPASSWNTEKDFQLNATQITDIKALKKSLSDSNQKLVAYVDPAVSVQNRQANPAYTSCAGKCFIRSTQYPEAMDGCLVNKKGGKNVVYYDWFQNGTQTQWKGFIANYFKDVGFDGLWTTENEPFGQVPGEVKVGANGEVEEDSVKLLGQQPFEASVDPDVDQSWFYSFWPLNRTSTFFLPFIPQYQRAGNYDNLTLSLNATHDSGETEYNLHNLYAHAMMKATFAAVNEVQNDTRPFLLTRGSYSSTGRYASQNLQTQVATYDTLYYSLQSALRSQIFGMSHSGADISCNQTGGVFDQELCLRFFQLAAWFPLARHVYTGPQSAPYNFNGEYYNQLFDTMHSRMQYLRLIYTCLQEVNDGGGSCLQPMDLLFDVPAGNALTEETFMVARALKISPVMHPLKGQKVYQSYFPAGNWVNMAAWSEIIRGNNGPVQLSVKSTANVHLAPGTLIPFQQDDKNTLKTAADVLARPIMLVVNRDQFKYAYGTLMLDQGVSKKEISDNDFEYYNIYAQANSIQFKPDDDYSQGERQPHTLDKFALVNAEDLSQVDFACFYRPNNLTPVELTPKYDPALKTVYLAPKDAQSVKFSEIENVYYGSSSKGDLNLCTPETGFQYKIVKTTGPDSNNLTNITGVQQVSFELEYKGNAKLSNVNLSVSFFDSGILNIKWSWADPTGKRRVFGVPDEVVNTTARDLSNLVDTLDRHIVVYNEPCFRLEVKTRISPSNTPTVFTLKGFMFHEYLNWLQVEAQAEATETEDEFRGIFGLGERSQKDFFMKTGVYPMWATDQTDPLENGRLPGKQVYGSHPFYMWKHSSNNWIGVYHNNANAQDWWIDNDFTSGKVSIQQIATGGLSDLYIMLPSQNPDGVVAKYHSLVGTPVLTPQWALGWHQCKWCYRTLQDVVTSLSGYLENQIPLDAQWIDIDYMQDYKDFTYNQADFWGQPGAFFGLQEFIDFLHHELNMRFVPIIDAGISYRPNEDYAAFDEGVKQGVFLKEADGSLSYGKVWANEAVFPDFSNPQANTYWIDQLDKFSKIIEFDGLWEDMNEASNFCRGKCFKDDLTPFDSIANRLPYTPTGKRLDRISLALDAKMNDSRSQLDAHSFYGTSQSRASSLYYQQKKQRPLIISRSTFAGHGKYASHWLGDNHALVEDMTISVVSSMKFNIFGVPLVGADICGVGGNQTTPELCARWHQIGAFQPFSRNHRDCQYSQEPWRFNETFFDNKTKTSYMDIMKQAIQRKYHLLRYYYTQMSQLSFGNITQSTVYKPLFFEFPEDPGAYTDIPNNVMIGQALKTSVNAVNLTQTETDFYFPAGTWCSLFEPVGDCITTEIGQTWPLPSTLRDAFVHIREGFVVPMQDATKLKANTSVDLQNSPVDLHILGQYRVPGIQSWAAEGLYVNDDGLTVDTQGNVNQYYIKATYTQSGLVETITVQFLQRMIASNYLNTTTNCSAVNAADWLQTLYIYNADSFKQHDTWLAIVSYTDSEGDYFAIGTAQFDQKTNRIVLDNSQVPEQWVCLTRAFRLVLKAQG